MIISNSELNDVERMHYLKTCLTEESGRLVGNLSATAENFTIAWTLLTSRYEHKRFLINAQLDRLANLKPLKIKNAKGLRILQTTILEAMAALKSLDCSVQYWDPLLLHQLTRLLDHETREDWEVSLGYSNAYPTMKQFEDFLNARTRAFENMQHSLDSGSNKEQRISNSSLHKPYSRNIGHATLSNSDINLTECILCSAKHYLNQCDQYKTKTSKQRKELLIKHHRCFNCLSAHNMKQCRSTRCCTKCGKKHHISIHFFDTESKMKTTSQMAKATSPKADTSQSTKTTD
ncbi:uncharacterized protein [Cardiocondyla obscurior]|uniref:uncharacterized protein n=1 Tax=Cardiocondyla obscurior TaxID=286306 RepID=UPI0039656BFF